MDTQTLQAMRLFKAVAANSFVAIVKFKSASRSAFKAEDGRPTKEIVQSPLTYWEVDMATFQISKAHIDGKFDLITEVHLTPLPLNEIKGEFKVDSKWMGDAAYRNLQNLISQEYEPEPQYFIITGPIAAKQITEVEFIGPISKAEIEDVSEAVKYVASKPANTLSEGEAKGLPANKNPWLKILGKLHQEGLLKKTSEQKK